MREARYRGGVIFSRVDRDGRFIEDVVAEALPGGCIESRPPEGFQAPKWTGSAWTEGRAASEVLSDAKAAKRAELSRAFVEANTALYPETEAAFSIWLAVPEYAASPNGARPQAIRANIARLREKLAAVGAATTVERVRAVSW